MHTGTYSIDELLSQLAPEMGEGEHAQDVRDVTELEDHELVRLAQREFDSVAADAREELTARYQPLVIGQAARLHRSRDTEHDDVIMCGQVGLQKAIDGFDPDRGSPFAAYARAKVRGEMMRRFRDARYAVHVPRPLHERFMQVRRAQADLERDLGRQATPADIAAHLEIGEDEVLEAFAAGSAERSRTARLEPWLGGAQEDSHRDLDLLDALNNLEDRERTLLYRRFWEGRSQAEVGRELDVSQAHVSRLEARALRRLREDLGEDLLDD